MVPHEPKAIPAALIDALDRLDRRLASDGASFERFSDERSAECVRALDAVRKAADAVRDRLEGQASMESPGASA